MQGVHIEKAVLSMVLTDPDTMAVFLADGVTPSDFTSPRHRVVFQVMGKMSADGVRIDPHSVVAQLEAQNFSEMVGGFDFLMELMDLLPDPSQVSSYSQIIRNSRAHAQLESALKRGQQILSDEGGGYEEASSFLDTTLTKIQNYVDASRGRGTIAAKDAISNISDRIADGWEHGNLVLQTGLEDLDLVLGGLLPGCLYVIAGRPGMGKTSLAMNIIESIATDDESPHAVGVFSLEMSAEELMFRMLGANSGVYLSSIKMGEMTDPEWDRLKAAQESLSKAPIYVDETPINKVSQVCNRARRLRANKGIDLLVVDYLQLLNGHGGASQGRTEAVSEISRELKLLAKELQVPIIAVSQLNRSVEKRTPPRPILSDLRESGSIEQDADAVMLLYKSSYYSEKLRHNPPALDKVEVNVAKHRHGSPGMVEVAWRPNIVRFEDLY